MSIKSIHLFIPIVAAGSIVGACVSKKNNDATQSSQPRSTPQVCLEAESIFFNDFNKQISIPEKLHEQISSKTLGEFAMERVARQPKFIEYLEDLDPRYPLLSLTESRAVVFASTHSSKEIIQSGEIMSFHQSRSSNGNHYPGDRGKFESYATGIQFGESSIFENVSEKRMQELSLRPKSGFFARNVTTKKMEIIGFKEEDDEGLDQMYGSAGFVLKPETLERSQWSPVDTLFSSVSSLRPNNSDPFITLACPLRSEKCVDLRREGLTDGTYNQAYDEVIVWGKIDLDDVEAIILPESHFNEQLLKLLPKPKKFKEALKKIEARVQNDMLFQGLEVLALIQDALSAAGKDSFDIERYDRIGEYKELFGLLFSKEEQAKKILPAFMKIFFRANLVASAKRNRIPIFSYNDSKQDGLVTTLTLTEKFKPLRARKQDKRNQKIKCNVPSVH